MRIASYSSHVIPSFLFCNFADARFQQFLQRQFHLTNPYAIIIIALHFCTMSDPSGFITNPPSTFVKIVGTSREDLNGLVCVALQYNAQTGRYVVQMLPGQASNAPRPGEAASAAAAARAAAGGSAAAAVGLSFKPENLVPCGPMEKVKAQATFAMHEAKRFVNSPDTKEKMRRLYTSLDQRLPPQVKPEYVGIGALIVLFIVVRIVGLSKLVLLTSLVLMLGMILMPDIQAGITDPSILASRFPDRLRANIAQATGYTSLTKKQAMIGFGIFMFFSLKLLATPAGSAVPPPSPVASRSAPTTFDPVVGDAGAKSPPLPSKSFDMEEIYKLGFEDAKDGKDFGASLPKTTGPSAPRGTSAADTSFDGLPPYHPSPPAAKESKFGLTWAMSAFGLFRGVKELGITPDGQFDPQYLVANVKVAPPLKLALLGFCLYRVLSAFM